MFAGPRAEAKRRSQVSTTNDLVLGVELVQPNPSSRSRMILLPRSPPHRRRTILALVIEVSSSTRRKDEARATLYARLKIPEYWLIDLERASVLVHRSPGHAEPIGYHYAIVTPFGRNADISSTVVAGLTFATSFLLQLATQS